MSSPPTYAEVVEAAGNLTADEQESLIETIRHRLAQRRREEILAEIEEARAALASGRVAPKTPQQIVDEGRP